MSGERSRRLGALEARLSKSGPPALMTKAERDHLVNGALAAEAPDVRSIKGLGSFVSPEQRQAAVTAAFRAAN